MVSHSTKHETNKYRRVSDLSLIAKLYRTWSDFIHGRSSAHERRERTDPERHRHFSYSNCRPTDAAHPRTDPSQPPRDSSQLRPDVSQLSRDASQLRPGS